MHASATLSRESPTPPHQGRMPAMPARVTLLQGLITPRFWPWDMCSHSQLLLGQGTFPTHCPHRKTELACIREFQGENEQLSFIMRLHQLIQQKKAMPSEKLVKRTYISLRVLPLPVQLNTYLYRFQWYQSSETQPMPPPPGSPPGCHLFSHLLLECLTP